MDERTVLITLNLSVTGDISDQQVADELIDWLLDITDGVDTPEWLFSFDGAEAKRG